MNEIMAKFDARARHEHAESVARGEHDTRCEYLAEPGFYLCGCSKRAREARGFTTPPALRYPPKRDRDWRNPVCLGCGIEVGHDGDGWNCSRCCCSWPSGPGPDQQGVFYDDYGDLDADLAKIRQQRAEQTADTTQETSHD